MKNRLLSTSKNGGIQTIMFDEKFKKMFKEHLFTAIKKFNSNRKTRIVHKLVDKNIIQLGFFSGESSLNYHGISNRGNMLSYIILNIYTFGEDTTDGGVVANATTLINLRNEVEKEKTYITDLQIRKIEKLKENMEEIQTKIIEELDYIKIVDGIYFAYLSFLSKYLLTEKKDLQSKIMTVISEILSTMIKNIYTKTGGTLETEEHQLLDAIAMYFILIYYFGKDYKDALLFLKKGVTSEIINIIEYSKVKRFNEFADIVNILHNTNLLVITAPVFEREIEKMIGEFAYKIYAKNSLQTFISIMAVLSQRNLLFNNVYKVDDKLHEQLESLLLNVQKFTTIKE